MVSYWQWMRDLHNCTRYTYYVSWTYIHQSVVFPLHSSFFLKVHSLGGGTPSHVAEWGRAECMRLHLGDVHIMIQIDQMMMTPSWLIQWSWSLVSRAHTIHSVYWVVCALAIEQLILIDIHLSPTDCLIVCPVSRLLVCVAQLLTCNLHCYNVYWLCIRGWPIQLLHHFINLIPRPSSCPALVAVWQIEWHESFSPILVYTIFAPWWYSMFVAAIARVMGFLWNMY